MNENDSIDSLLDDTFKGDIDSAVGTDTPPAPRYRTSNNGRRLRLLGLSSIPLALSFRLVTALAAAGVAAAGGTAVLVSSHGHGTPGGTQQSTTVTVTGTSPSAGATNHGSVVTSAV